MKYSQRVYLCTLLHSLESCFLVLTFISDISGIPLPTCLSVFMFCVAHFVLYLIVGAAAHNLCHNVDISNVIDCGAAN